MCLLSIQRGGGEIRTHGPVAQTPVFKTGAIDHSATPPRYPEVLSCRNTLPHFDCFLKGKPRTFKYE